MQVKCRLHNFVPHKFYHAMHNMLKRKFFERIVLRNLHNFFMCILMLLYSSLRVYPIFYSVLLVVLGVLQSCMSEICFYSTKYIGPLFI